MGFPVAKSKPGAIPPSAQGMGSRWRWS